MRVIACGAPYGAGGLGQHVAQLIEEAREAGLLAGYYALETRPGDAAGRRVGLQDFKRISRYTLVRFSPGWTNYLHGELFDRKVAARLAEPADLFMGFGGESLHCFRRASEIGFGRLALVAANSHVRHVRRAHERARRQSGIHDGWLNAAQLRKTCREYEMADVIYVHSEYTRRSLIAEGVAAAKLERTVLRVNPRFEPPTQRPEDGVFRVAYVGRVDTTKGIPVLLEAFSRLSVPKAALTLVGGWSTRPMRRHMQRWLRRDPRIRLAPGDPLPILQQADVLVHPTFEDGFGYAPMEALACGVPVIVTEDTGMKEYVQEGVNGYVVPTGDWQALLERMEHIARHPLARTRVDAQFLAL